MAEAKISSVALTAAHTPEGQDLIKAETSRPPTNGAVSQNVPQATHMPEETLIQLSRQLEYYFSSVNLSRDTYLRTLRELNDGYVPATILATFAKVQMLCPIDSYNAVIKAASEYSDNLEVVFVDKETSKQVSAEGPHTLLAIGPQGQKPIELPTTPVTPRPVVNIAPDPPDMESISAPPMFGFQNTIILREVPQGISEDEVRTLFNFEKCPPIQHVVEDVSNYWFVTLKATSRDDMLDVMLALRSKTLRGEPLKARLKSGSIASSDPQIYAGDRNLPYDPKLKLSKRKSGNPLQASPKDGKKGNRRNNRRSKKESSPGTTKQINQAPPPPLVESQFPSLEPVARILDPVVPPKSKDDDDEEKPMSSDGASTATTSTSSSFVGDGPKPKITGGYAAALLKVPPAKPPTPPSSNAVVKDIKIENVVSDGKKHRNGRKDTGVPKEVGTHEQKLQDKPSVIETVTQVMAWGGGRSFADVLKKEETSAQNSSS